MSLHGSLETLPIADVLALLASTGKTGVLHVAGDHGEGRLWVARSAVVAARADRCRDPVEVLFLLLCNRRGEFSFEAGDLPPDAGPPQPVERLLVEALARLEEWRRIEAVLPSGQHLVRLAAEVPEGGVTVDGDSWQVLVAVQGSATVQEVLDRLDRPGFEAARLLHRAVTAGLVGVHDPVAAAHERWAAPEPRSEAALPGAGAPHPAGPAPAPRPAAGSTGPAAAPAASPVPTLRSAAVPPGPPGGTEPAAGAVQVLVAEDRAPADEGAGRATATGGAVPASAAAAGPAEAAPLAEGGPADGSAGPAGDDQVDRGLLVKFLSSVRA